MKHEEYMRQALELARLAMAEGEVPVGCVVGSPAVVKRQEVFVHVVWQLVCYALFVVKIF